MAQGTIVVPSGEYEDGAGQDFRRAGGGPVT